MAVGDRIVTTVDLGEHIMTTSTRVAGAELNILQKVGPTTDVITQGVDVFDTSTNVSTDGVRIGFRLENLQSSGAGRLVTSSHVEVNGIPTPWTTFDGNSVKTIASGQEVFASGLVNGRVTNISDLTLPINSLTSLIFVTSAIKTAGGGSGGVQFEIDVFIEGSIIHTIPSSDIFNQTTGETISTNTFDGLLTFLTNLPSIYSTL